VAQEAHHLARVDLEVDAGEDVVGAVGHLQAGDPEDRLA
jgi:hypothetical protein